MKILNICLSSELSRPHHHVLQDQVSPGSSNVLQLLVTEIFYPQE